MKTVNLCKVLDACLSEAIHYTFDRHELHRVAPVKTDRPVSTLVLIGKWQRDGSDVYTDEPRHGADYRAIEDPHCRRSRRTAAPLPRLPEA